MSDECDEFSVWLFLSDGTSLPECRFVDAETAVKNAKLSKSKD
jgi:hypothetical protein